MERRRMVRVQKRYVGRELRLPRQHERLWLRHVPSLRYLCRVSRRPESAVGCSVSANGAAGLTEVCGVRAMFLLRPR